MITTVTLNPAVDITIEIDDFNVGFVNRAVNKRKDPGGKGINVSRVIKGLKEETTAIGFVGGKNGEFIIDSLKKEGINYDFVLVDRETRENIKIVDRLNKTFTDINLNGEIISEEKGKELLKKVDKWAAKSSVMVFSGSIPKGINNDIYAQMIKIANNYNIKSILDSEGDSFIKGLQSRPYLVKPNKEELENTFKVKLNNIVEVIEFSRKNILSQGVKIAVISMGEQGSLALSKNEGYFASPLQVEVKSTVGAGDSMVAMLAIALHHDYPLPKALKMASAAAAASITKPGTELATLEELTNFEEKIKINKIGE